MAKKNKAKSGGGGGFLNKLVNSVKNASIMDEGVSTAEWSDTIDTGCYILNALLSGSIYGGMQDNKVMVLAGDPSTGKTFIAMSILAEFLKNKPEALAIHMDTESAVTKDMMVTREIDPTRVVHYEPLTIEEFRDTALKFLDTCIEEKDAPEMLMILDSLSLLSTFKETFDIVEEKTNKDGATPKDMTKPGATKAMFRMIRNKLAQAKVPLIITNHVYANVGPYGPPKVISGGSGLVYSSDTILMLTKAKEEADKKQGKLLAHVTAAKEFSGVIITVTTYKSRLTRENKSVQIRVSYNTGLDRYYGLFHLALRYGIIKEDGKQYLLADGRKVYGKTINREPETVYTPEILDLLDEAARKEFCYGQGEGPAPGEANEEDDVEAEVVE